MISEHWQEWDFIDWGKGLGLLTLPWIRPFLVIMEVPDQLAAQPELWTDLYEQARTQYFAPSGLVRSPRSLEQEHLPLQPAFERLLLRTDLKTVNDLCQWFDRHFRNNDFSRAIRQWQLLLTKVLWPPEQLFPKISYPNDFQPLIPELAQLVWHRPEQVRLELLAVPITFLVPAEDPDQIEMRRVILEQAREQGKVGDPEGNPWGDADRVYTVIGTELTIKAIQLINRHPERETLMTWLYEVNKVLNPDELAFLDVQILKLYDDSLN
jgi:hypothetical protein